MALLSLISVLLCLTSTVLGFFSLRFWCLFLFQPFFLGFSPDFALTSLISVNPLFRFRHATHDFHHISINSVIRASFPKISVIFMIPHSILTKFFFHNFMISIIISMKKKNMFFIGRYKWFQRSISSIPKSRLMNL